MTTIPTHKAAELIELSAMPSREKGMTVVVFGRPGTGKTRLICSAPGPVGVIPLNSKCRATVENVAKDLYPDKKFYFPKQDLIRHANPMQLAMMLPECTDRKKVPGMDAPACCAQHYYRWHMNRVKDAVWTMAEHKSIKSIAIDDTTVMYDDVLFAHYGRSNQISDRRTAYGPPNREMIEVINGVKGAGKHLVLLSQCKEEYRGEVRTGNDTIAGFKQVGYDSTVILEMTRDQKTNDFYASVRLCQENASLNGDAGKNFLKNEDITFLNLAMQIYGDDIDVTEYL